MNFLAHFHLAWPEPPLIAGALEGDYHKGPLHSAPPRLAAGIELHRAIDAFTDEHPLVRELKSDFPSGLRRFAGILIDLGFDHFLTRHWSEFSQLPLPHFNARVYHTLAASHTDFSPGARRMAGRLAEFDILGAYGEWDSVPASAERVGERFRRGNPLRQVGTELEPLAPAMERTFVRFYPELQRFSRDWQRRRNQPQNRASKIAPTAKTP